ncbi:hypothetical protein KM043_018614 [Ampulex compressa]|nr:hypothetical protein KM043_018614 [Ampulex compressa]
MLPLIYCIAGTFCATLVDNVRPDILEKRRRTKALSIANEQNLYNFVYLKTHVNLYVEANLIHQIQEIVTTMGNGTFAKLEISEVQETKSGHKSPNLEVIRILHVMNCCFNDVQQKYIALLDEIVDGIDASSRYNDTLNSLPQTCEEQEDPLTCYDQGG